MSENAFLHLFLIFFSAGRAIPWIFFGRGSPFLSFFLAGAGHSLDFFRAGQAISKLFFGRKGPPAAGWSISGIYFSRAGRAAAMLRRYKAKCCGKLASSVQF